MTMPSSVSRARFKGNGTATEFPFAFKVWDVSQLTVTLTDPDGKSSPAASWTAELADDGGTVTYFHDGSPLPEGWLLAITRNMPFTQGIDLVSATRFDPAVMEDGLDMAAAERQQLREQLSRSVILPPTSDQSPQELADRLLEAEKQAEHAAQRADTAAMMAGSQADNAAKDADSAAIQAALADDAARLARAWAESPTPPDPDGPASKSAREWAMIAADTVPLATSDRPGKASFPPPFTIDAQGTAGIRDADTNQNGLVRLTNSVNSATGTLAASDTAVKTAHDAATAAAAAAETARENAAQARTVADEALETAEAALAGTVTLFGSRSTKGDWTLTGLRVGRPLLILQNGPSNDVGYAEFKVTSGSHDGSMTANFGYQTGYVYGKWVSTNCFIAIPTATSVTININHIEPNVILRAYQ